ncbi:hypothetical protein AVEN_268091-1 [Araneus ventricosus]|uniref:Uncharacterized protein n=1 Tax=Araneus ventricosus TaxID=182803 RepID=A0A4Y2VGR9_ARAVE|nr:hypothetical protein AVEN_106974-1 [Araneus ventricosus]GBO24739.1 hypothetical protein AVEN_268091-1 [Araneus ventricosus]
MLSLYPEADGRGGLVVRPQPRDRKVAGSKPDSTEDPPWCDSGFGHKLAQKLDDLGLQVFAGCLNPDGEGAKSLKKTASAKLQVLPLDVTSEESVDKFHKQVVQKIKDNSEY